MGTTKKNKMFITLTLYNSTNRVRLNVNNISYYKHIKVDTAHSKATGVLIEVYKTGIYFLNDPVPVVVEEETAAVDKMIETLLCYKNETVV